MATPDVRGAYELLRRAMQQNYLQQQGGGSCPMPNSAPGFNSDGYDSPQGGLLGRLLALDSQSNPYQPLPENSRAAPAVPPDPNFRQLLRVPSGNRTQGAIAAPTQYQDQSSTSYGQPIVSDVTPDPSMPGSLLGGTTVLNSRKRPPSGDDEEDVDRTTPKAGTPEWRSWYRKQRDAQRRARDIAGRKALTDTDPDDCTNRYDDEKKRCFGRWYEYNHRDFLADCWKRARKRYLMCHANDGVPDPTEPPEWEPNEGDVYFEHGR